MAIFGFYSSLDVCLGEFFFPNLGSKVATIDTKPEVFISFHLFALRIRLVLEISFVLSRTRFFTLTTFKSRRTLLILIT